MGEKGKQALWSPGLSCFSPGLEKLQADHRGAWEEVGEQLDCGTKEGHSAGDEQAGPQDSPTKSRSLVASMLLTVMAPNFSSGQGGKGRVIGQGWRAKWNLLYPESGCPAISPWPPFREEK